MSNCIEFMQGRETIVLRPSVFNVSQLQEVTNQLQGFKSIKDAEAANMSYPWWFLDGNVTFSKRDGSAIIRFGESHSIHTWRDFKWTLLYLSEFILPGKSVHTTVYVRDTDAYGHGRDNKFQPLNISLPMAKE
jgi:hypothetical protein